MPQNVISDQELHNLLIEMCAKRETENQRKPLDSFRGYVSLKTRLFSTKLVRGVGSEH